jgi:hypothetical protein
MDIDPNKLPSDPVALQQIVLTLLNQAEERERLLKQMQHQLERLLRWRFGPRSERVDENQLFLFAAEVLRTGAGAEAPAGEPAAAPAPKEKNAGKPNGHGRQRLPESLERRRVVHDLAEAERRCPQCQGELRHIGEEVSEQLEYVPASLVVIQEACQK